jgi:hypothetical protein
MIHTNRNLFAMAISVAGLGIGGLAPGWLFAQSDTPTIDAQAREKLQTSLAFLAGQKRISVDTRNITEVVLASGQKIQFDGSALLTVQRPDKLRASRRGDLVDQDFFYDGVSLTLHNPGENFYATVAAPGSLEAMLDYARETLGIIAPAGDLAYSNAYEILMDNVTSGFVVGTAMLEGVACDHLAFRGEGVDWQIWIQQGDQPLPRRFVITTLDVAGAPQFSVEMSNWNLAPAISEDTFRFVPPPGAIQVEFLPLVSAQPATP